MPLPISSHRSSRSALSSPGTQVSLYDAEVQDRELSVVAQCESLRYKLLNSLAVRRACYGVLCFIMESGAKGCEVAVSGKLRYTGLPQR
ncbi:40s ribosomal protein s3 [Zalerion maritima]|uniref:40S ribosomal protein S3 n=1 Tax=Zalerion maritima TaxID=339359 RepID=A0AAD5WNS1_9PEZI|nr:40s ribosomal protein s3 [Zalerion maritima]